MNPAFKIVMGNLGPSLLADFGGEQVAAFKARDVERLFEKIFAPTIPSGESKEIHTISELAQELNTGNFAEIMLTLAMVAGLKNTELGDNLCLDKIILADDGENCICPEIGDAPQFPVPVFYAGRACKIVELTEDEKAFFDYFGWFEDDAFFESDGFLTVGVDKKFFVAPKGFDWNTDRPAPKSAPDYVDADWFHDWWGNDDQHFFEFKNCEQHKAEIVQFLKDLKNGDFTIHKN